MAFTLYLHPLSSYCQKAKTAFYEKGVPFEVKMIDGSQPVASEFAALWPLAKFPMLVDSDQLVFEATGIIEHLEARFPQTPHLIPADALVAAQAACGTASSTTTSTSRSSASSPRRWGTSPARPMAGRGGMRRSTRPMLFWSSA